MRGIAHQKAERRRPGSSRDLQPRALRSIWEVVAVSSALLAISVALAVLNILVGPRFNAPALYTLPVAMATRVHTRLGLALACVLVTVRATCAVVLWRFDTPTVVTNFFANALMLFLVVFLVERSSGRASSHAKGERAVARPDQEPVLEPRSATGKDIGQEQAAPSGLLCMCAACKKIRDEHGAWLRTEAYLLSRLGLQVTHGFCCECARTWYPDHYPRDEG
jgi:hypothetical protein